MGNTKPDNAPAKGVKDLKAPELYINRELSWLEFNDRVLQEGLSDDLPLLERLKFLAIVASNLDEFFMVRVAGLIQQRSAKVGRADASGMTPGDQIEAVGRRVRRMVAEQTAGIQQALKKLAKRGVSVVERKDWDASEERFLRSYFVREVMPILTPLAVQDIRPAPALAGLRLHVGLVLRTVRGDEAEEKIAVVPVPGQLPRFVALPSEAGLRVARQEDIVAANAASLFPGCEVLACGCFRITRDGNVEIQDDDALDLLHVVEEAVHQRRRRAAVRLEISAGLDARIRRWLLHSQKLHEDDVHEIDGMIDASGLWNLVNRPGNDELKAPEWPAQTPRDLLEADDLWQVLKEREVLLFHPYESFEPVVQLLERAAVDPGVLAIKQTLYRTSGDSPIVRALERAAQNGKEVSVLVELKARFDEARNVTWARRLEDAGANVIYGIAGYKTHAKALLIVRREAARIRRYVHLSTGNYNDRTARLYSDLGFMTAQKEITADVAAFFNLLTGYSESVEWNKLACEPGRLKQRFIDLIEREIEVSSPDRSGLVMAKLNSLQDRDICRALYRAGQAGVKVMLNIRGICCLRPGIAGVSENIEVRSIVDRYLEHARIFFFRNGGHEEVYLSSADWMYRNLERRLELLFPVAAPPLRRRLIEILRVCFADNVKTRTLQPDGTYPKAARKGAAVRAQEHFHKEAVDAAQAAAHAALRFQPLKRPDDASS
jgi:polyphosphate kinase